MALTLRFYQYLTDAGLAAAARLSRLQRLDPAATAARFSYSAAGVAALRQALPLCRMALARPNSGGALTGTNEVHSLPPPVPD